MLAHPAQSARPSSLGDRLRSDRVRPSLWRTSHLGDRECPKKPTPRISQASPCNFRNQPLKFQTPAPRIPASAGALIVVRPRRRLGRQVRGLTRSVSESAANGRERARSPKGESTWMCLRLPRKMRRGKSSRTPCSSGAGVEPCDMICSILLK